MNDQLRPTVMDYQTFLFRMFRSLSDLRLAGNSPSVAWDEVRSLICRGQGEGHLSVNEAWLLSLLSHNALARCSDLNFPDAKNAGPFMPTSVWYERHVAAPKASTEVLTNAPTQVPAQAALTGLRLLCLLDHSNGRGHIGPRYLPVHTMSPVPPRSMVRGKWSEPRYAGLYLRETHAKPASSEVLARYIRYRQADALRSLS